MSFGVKSFYKRGFSTNRKVSGPIAETWWSFRAITSDPGELLCGTRIVVYNLKKIRVLKVKFYTPAAR